MSDEIRIQDVPVTPTYLLPPKTKPGLLDPLGPPAEVDFFIRFQGSAGRIGPCRKNQDSTKRTRAPRDGPARRIRAPQDRSGPVGRIRAPQDRSGPAGRIRAPQDRSGPAGRIRAPQDRSGPRKTDQVPQGESGPVG